MKIKAILLFVVGFGVGIGHADFQYTQSSKITGGALVNMTKALGVFSKNARQVTDPQVSTIMLKNNMLRTEHADGSIEIIDAEDKRFINIDPAKKTYSSMTFDEFKNALQRTQERAKEEQAKELSKHPEAANVKITPKIDMQETGASRTVLNLPAKEVKMKIEMLIESSDPKAQEKAQSAAITVNSDSWIAASVAGYSEVREFYLKLAKELDWLPGTMGSMAGMNMNPQMGPAMEEFRKSAVKLQGMPLLQTMSLGMGAQGQQGQAPQAQQPTQQSQDSQPASPREALSKSLGGMFGRKKKQQDQDNSNNSGGASAQPAASSGSLMDMQTEVTSYSSNSLDKTLFEIPAGFTQVQRDPNEMMGGRKSSR